MSKDEQIYHLYKLLDDIDTLDDAVKSDDEAFRVQVRRVQIQRHKIVDSKQADELYDKYYKEQP